MVQMVDASKIPEDLIKDVDDMIKQGNASGPVAAVETILEKLKGHKLAWTAQIAPEMVGVHHSNRSGASVDPLGAQMLGSDILRDGWSWGKANSGALCVEAPPHQFSKTDTDFNMRLVSLSQGTLPPLQAMQFLSLGGGHTNSFL